MKKCFLAVACAISIVIPTVSAADKPAEDKRLKVAIVDFQNQTGDASNDALAKGISDSMINELQKTGAFRLIERKRLESVLSELKLNMSGLVDSNTAKQVGNQLGVDALLFGNLSSVKYSTGKSTIFLMWTETQKTEVTMDGRLVNVETGEIIKSAKAVAAVKNRKWVAFWFARIGKIIDKSAVVQTGIEEGCKKLAKEISK
ncbi:MAG: CsgG/HfaB family protein [Elusimicrobiota bacterium]